MKEERQEQEKDPGVLRHAAFVPQIPGVAAHSSISRQSVPKNYIKFKIT